MELSVRPDDLVAAAAALRRAGAGLEEVVRSFECAAGRCLPALGPVARAAGADAAAGAARAAGTVAADLAAAAHGLVLAALAYTATDARLLAPGAG